MVLACVCAALRVAYGRFVTTASKEQLRSAWTLFTPHNKLKICIGFYQIITKIDNVYEVVLPPEVKRMLNVFSTGVSFGLSSASTVLECLGLQGYVATLTLYIVTPLAIAAAIVVVTAYVTCSAKPDSEKLPASGLRRSKAARDIWSQGQQRSLQNRPRSQRSSQAKDHALALFEKALPALLQLAFLAYPVVATKAFEAFSCYTFTASRYLKADVAIRCDSDEHQGAKNLAAIAIFLYPIGEPCVIELRTTQLCSAFFSC